NNFWRGDGTAAGTFPLTDAQDPTNFGAEPSALARVGNALYFWAHDDAANWEIWKSDGTGAGTRKVKEINPGPASAWSPEAPLPHRVVVPLQGTAYFTATDGVNGTELWKTDGTEAGTVMVKDIRPGAGSSMPHNLTVRDGVLYFAANDGVNGTELWRSDGTAAGTRLVRNIRPSAGSGLGDFDAFLAVANGTLYFAASDGTSGHELWKSDGTEAGTGRVKDLVPGTGSSSPQNLVSVHGTLFFTAWNGADRYDLWKSDGTAGGTVRVRGPVPDQYRTPPYQLTDVNGTLYFVQEHPFRTYTLWKSDGTEAGTLPLKTFANVAAYDPPLQHLTNLNGTLYFTASDPQKGYELWKSNGTAAGTALVTDLTPGIQSGTTGSPAGTPFSQLANLNGTLYFGARGLYRSDGTAAGTVCISNLYPEWPEVANLKHLTLWNGTLYFTASSATTGNELWKYDPAGCVMPNPGLAVTTSPVCLGSEAVVRVTGSQPGVRYQLSFNGSLLGRPVAGGGDIALVVPPVSLAPGAYPFAVRAVGCTEVTLTQRATVTVSEVNAPVVNGVILVGAGQATLTAGGAPAGGTYRWYDGPSGGVPLGEGPAFTTPVLTATRVYYAAAYQAGCSESTRTMVTVTVTPSPAASSYRINAGGSAHATTDGRAFSADAYFTGGIASVPVAGEVAGTPEDALYRTGRHGTTFAYALPLAPGDYRVVLHFNETYWGNGRSGGVGSRKFNVDLEGVRRLTEYDIFATVGG
ncbi:MAG TPA: ELWxxDGT repeat protein, partial [Cytophagales bacterium]